MSLQVENKKQIILMQNSSAPITVDAKNMPIKLVDNNKLNDKTDEVQTSNTQVQNKTINNTSLRKIYETFQKQIIECGFKSVNDAIKQDFLTKITGKTNEQLVKMNNTERTKLTNEINIKIKIAQRIAKSKNITLDNILEARREFDALNQIFDIETLQNDIRNGGKKFIGHEGIEGLMERYYTSIKKAGGFDKLSREEKIKYMNRFFAGNDFKNDKAQLQSFAKLFVNSSLENRRLMVGVIKSLSANNRETAVDCWLNGFIEGDERKNAVNKSEKDGTLDIGKITMGSSEHFDEIEGHKAFDKYNPPMEKGSAARVTALLVGEYDQDSVNIEQKRMETLKRNTLEKQHAYKSILAKIKNGEKPTVEEAKLLKEYYKLKELGYDMKAEYDALTGTISGTIVGYSINEALQEVLEGHDKTIAEELIAESNKSNQELSKTYGIDFDKDVDNSINILINDIAENHPELLGELSKEDFLAQVKDTINKATDGSFYENIGETPKNDNKTTVEEIQNKIEIKKESSSNVSIGFAKPEDINVATIPTDLTKNLYNITITNDSNTEKNKKEIKENKPIEKCLTIEEYASNDEWNFFEAADKFGYFSTIAFALQLDKNDKAHQLAIRSFANNTNWQDDTIKRVGLLPELVQFTRYSVLESLKGVTLATTKMTNDLKGAIKKAEEKKS